MSFWFVLHHKCSFAVGGCLSCSLMLQCSEWYSGWAMEGGVRGGRVVLMSTVEGSVCSPRMQWS